MIAALQELYQRDLNKLKTEIESYQDESKLWVIEKSIKNSAGNLCLHIVGNLMTYIGNGLGQIGYIRNREFEFAGKDVNRAELYIQIEQCIEVVIEGLSKVSTDELDQNYPIKIWQEEKGMAFTLIHLYAHLTHHLGQINYHRRLLHTTSS
ncbi:MAG: DUF1572 family protein [Bacteroidota bacterium]